MKQRTIISIFAAIFATIAVVFLFGPKEQVLAQTTRLIKTQDNPTVYTVASNGTKRAFINEAVFKSYGHRPNQISIVTQAQLDAIPRTQALTTPNDPTIYRLNTDYTVQGIATWEAFLALGLDMDDVVTINTTELGFYPKGEVLNGAAQRLDEFESALNNRDQSAIAALLTNPIMIGPLASEFSSTTPTSATQTLLTQIGNAGTINFSPDNQITDRLEQYSPLLQQYVIGLSEPMGANNDRVMIAYHINSSGQVDQIIYAPSLCFVLPEIPCTPAPAEDA